MFNLIMINTNAQFQDYNNDQKQTEKTTSEIIKTDKGYQLLINGKPFYIKGAGLGGGSVEALAANGANALRTWSMSGGKALLNEAHKHSLKVMMGIWVGLERHGFNYDDDKAVEEQFRRIKKSVLELKDHPALMMWCIGNELNLQYTNPKVWNAAIDISKMIHEVDPNHLTTTALAGVNPKTVKSVTSRAADIDFLSVQLYAGIDRLPQLLKATDYKGPLAITEWGATGYWEVQKTSWGAPIENNSSVKADLYLKRYNNYISSLKQQIIGSFVFLWGQKQERTPTWFGLFMPDGSETESIDVMHYIWNKEWPENRTPRINDFTLNGKQPLDDIKLKAGNTCQANIDVSDPDGDEMTFIWSIMEESNSNKSGGDREEVPKTLNIEFSNLKNGKTRFEAPKQPGAYRLYIEVKDGNNHTAHANIPFFVR